MKKALMILLALAMVFGFVACDNDTPEPKTVMTEELAKELDDSLGSIAWNAETGTADIKKGGAYFQKDITAGETYTVSYDLTLKKASSGTVELNHNLVTKEPSKHYCQAYLVLTLSDSGVAVAMRPGTSEGNAEQLESISYTGDVAKVNVKATYAPNSVTLSVNGDTAKAVTTTVTADSIFWCLYSANEDAGSIDSFTVV